MEDKKVEKIDAVIEKISDDIVSGNIHMDFRADTVKALAALVEARAKLYHSVIS